MSHIIFSAEKRGISIHGKKGVEEFIMLGGLAENLISRVKAALEEKGFIVLSPEHGVEGDLAANICNKGAAGEGLQVELSRGLRDAFAQNPEKLKIFSQAVRTLLV
jgi:phage replication-related protein YjqB (UPF0714/DUF867 family)